MTAVAASEAGHPVWADMVVAAASRETRHAAVCLIVTTP